MIPSSAGYHWFCVQVIAVNFRYDVLDRRTGIVYSAESTVNYFYDKVDRVTNINDSVAGNIAFTYDTLDRLTQETNVNGVVNYLYNDLGLRTNMTITGVTSARYTYDALNRLTAVIQATYTNQLSYDALGRRTQMTLPNGINVLYAYDTASRLTNITYHAAVTNQIDYTYDAVGNRAAQASLLANYNLPSIISTTLYDAANRQLQFGSYKMLYDAVGNATNIINGAVTNNLTFNARNQLTNMTGAVAATFLYDGLGRRITRTVAGATERYFYDGLDMMVQRDSAGAVRGALMRGLGIDEPWGRQDIGAAATNRVYLADALGSIVALTDGTRVIQTEYDYTPFGETTTTGASNKNSYKFTAREDDATGLYYYRARYYHPTLGRFISEDPIEYVGGDINLYGYVSNNSLNLRDPLGESAAANAMAAAAGAAALSDGPLPIGDVIALGIIATYLATREWCPLEDEHNLGRFGYRCEYWCRRSGQKIVVWVPPCEGGCPSGVIGW